MFQVKTNLFNAPAGVNYGDVVDYWFHQYLPPPHIFRESHKVVFHPRRYENSGDIYESVEVDRQFSRRRGWVTATLKTGNVPIISLVAFDNAAQSLLR